MQYLERLEEIFEDLFGPDLVVPLDSKPRSPAETREALAAIWGRRDEYLAQLAVIARPTGLWIEAAAANTASVQAQ